MKYRIRTNTWNLKLNKMFLAYVLAYVMRPVLAYVTLQNDQKGDKIGIAQ